VNSKGRPKGRKGASPKGRLVLLHVPRCSSYLQMIGIRTTSIKDRQLGLALSMLLLALNMGRACCGP
jgi:hypothetical protein